MSAGPRRVVSSSAALAGSLRHLLFVAQHSGPGFQSRLGCLSLALLYLSRSGGSLPPCTSPGLGRASCSLSISQPRLVRGFSFTFSLSLMVIGSFVSFGFGGSRSGCPQASVSLPAFAAQVRVLQQPQVFISSASGVSALARSLFPSAQVFSSGSSGVTGAVGAGLFAARGAALVRALRASPHPLWVCWPGQACPSIVRPSSSPSRCWCGGGSGSWAESAMSAGLGIPVLVILPAGVLPPASWGTWQPWWGGWLLLPVPSQALF